MKMDDRNIKQRAHQAVRSALKKGKLSRKSCEICASPNSLAHHDDYFKPLNISWLCGFHHQQRHQYIGYFRDGIWEPFTTSRRQGDTRRKYHHLLNVMRWRVLTPAEDYLLRSFQIQLGMIPESIKPKGATNDRSRKANKR